MLPEDIVQQTLNNNTHLYLSVEEENQQYPRIHYRHIFPGLRYPRQIQTVSSEIFLIQINHQVVQNYLWVLHNIGGVYTPWIRKAKMGLACNNNQCKWELHQC